MTVYGTGMRRSEVVHLKVSDIDSQRMIIRVSQGKGSKDRDLPLSPELLETSVVPWRNKVILKNPVKLKITLIQSDTDGRSVLVFVGVGSKGTWHHVETGFDGDPQSATPLHLLPKRSDDYKGVWDDYLNRYWICRRKVFLVENAELVSRQELQTRLQHAALKEERDYRKLQRELQALENLPLADDARRERIPEDVRLFVWQRDEGKCVKCGSNRNLEFDHIIPVAEGGGNTSRNIQLLCESCNRQKGKTI